jgi:cobalt-zinc-cadmium efflux system membrane fusion protein
MKRLPMFVLLAVAGCAAAGCRGGSGAAAANGEARERAKQAHESGHAHAGERASGEEVSDLDQPVEELFAMTCEHGRKTHECQECRYEAGVVRAPERLFACGLMKRAQAERRRVESALSLTGEVQFDERKVTHVGSQAEGVVRRVHVTLGDRVRQGQPLVELESVAVGEAQAAYLEAQAALVLARQTHERQVRLRKELISSEKEYLQAKQDLDAAQIRATGALGRLTRLGMEPGAARTLSQQEARGRLVLRAPAGGVVLSMHAVPGEVVQGEEPLLTLGDNSAVWVWASIYERDMAQVKRAQSHGKLSASVSVKAYPGEAFPATVDFVSPVMDEPSRTIKVRVEVPNPEGRLLAGMFATVKVFLPGDEEVLVVPAAAVLEDEGRSFIFMHHHGDYFVRRPVTPGRSWDRATSGPSWGDLTTGRSWDHWVEVRTGLTGGETIVADGAFLMKSDVLRSKMGAGCAD